MRTHIPLTLGLVALLLLAAACSSGSAAQPATVRNYGPEAGATSSTVGSPGVAPAAPAWNPAPAAGGPITWHTRLADAQAAANASGKMILVMSTKPRCGLCKKFQNEIAPATAGELSRVAVGYVYDITRPEVRDVDRLLRANLRGADLMPLVGFITPSMRWVHGFWGQRSVQQFRGDIARATSIHPVRTADAGPMQIQGPAEAPRMVLNEFGEREWGVKSDIWPAGDPEPIDAITGAPDALPDRVPAPTGGAMLADAGPAPAAPATSDPISAEPAPLPEVPAPAVPAADEALATLPPIGGGTPEPAADPAPAPAPAPGNDESWARQELERALGLIRSGEFDSARATLAQVRDRLPDTQLAREASKGGVALYNAKKIRFASNGAERDRYLSRARRDFGGSMWAPLFNS